MTRSLSVLLTGVALLGLSGIGHAEIKLPERVQPAPREKPAPAIHVPAPIDAAGMATPKAIDGSQPDALNFFNKDSLRGHLVSVQPGEFGINKPRF